MIPFLAPKDSVLSEAVGTAKFCIFMDKTFDSVNAQTINPELGKPLRSAVKNKSPHVEHWNYAIKVFQSMKFINKHNGKTSVPPCIKNWIITLKSFKYLWFRLQKCNFNYLLPRHINQDPLECLFGSVRSHGARNINPDSYQFVCSLKTLLINNFTSLKSAGNCELDDCDEALDNLRKFVEVGSNSSNKIIPESTVNIPIINLPDTLTISYFSEMTIGYVCGYLARATLKETKFCKLCKNELVGNKENHLIRARDYTTKSLFYPSQKFQSIIEQMLYVSKYILCNIHEENIGKQLIFMFKININFSLNCPKHDLKNVVFEKFKNFFIFTYLKNINRILNGLDKYYDNTCSDPLKMAAHDYYLKHKTKKKSC